MKTTERSRGGSTILPSGPPNITRFFCVCASAFDTATQEVALNVRRIGLEVVTQQISFARSFRIAGSKGAQVALGLWSGEAIRVSYHVERTRTSGHRRKPQHA